MLSSSSSGFGNCHTLGAVVHLLVSRQRAPSIGSLFSMMSSDQPSCISMVVGMLLVVFLVTSVQRGTSGGRRGRTGEKELLHHDNTQLPALSNRNPILLMTVWTTPLVIKPLAKVRRGGVMEHMTCSYRMQATLWRTTKTDEGSVHVSSKSVDFFSVLVSLFA